MAQQKAGHDPPGDLELIAAINQGDEAAFEVVYPRYRDWVTGLAYRFTGDEGTSLDILQENLSLLSEEVSRLPAHLEPENVPLSCGAKPFNCRPTQSRTVRGS